MVNDDGSSRARTVLGLPFAALSSSDAVQRARDAVQGSRRLVVCALNAPKVVRMRRDPEFRQAVLGADLLIPDGMSLVWASTVLGGPLPERVTGIGLMYALLAAGAEAGWRFYCLGASEAVNGEAVEAFRAAHPGLEIAGRHHGFYPRAEEPEVVEHMAAAAPDVVFVALNTPSKERFIHRWGDQIGASVYLGVGGAFDVAAGHRRRAPAWLQRAGMEWLWRMGQHPTRTWPSYFANNATFAALVARDVLWPGSYAADLERRR